jgi:hypothetical protein
MDGVDNIISLAKNLAGLKIGKVVGGLSIKEIKIILGKNWVDANFVGWNFLSLSGKWLEFKWRLFYGKLKMPRKEFKLYEECIWCKKIGDNKHLFSCDKVFNVLVG